MKPFNQIVSGVLLLCLFIFGVNAVVSAQAENIEDQEDPQMIEQLTKHMSELEKQMDVINRTQDPHTKQILLNQHFESLKQHVNMLSEMSNNYRMMGSKSHRRRMNFRVQSFTKNLQSFIQELQDHYGNCELKAD